MSTTPISSMLRITGLNSGLDTDSIVTSLMQIEQLKVDRVFRQKTTLEWQLEANQAIKSAITSFRQTNMSALSATNLYSAAAFNTFKVTTATATAATSVDIKATADAQAGTVTIDQITRIAAAATTGSTTAISGGTSLDRSATLAGLSLATPLVFSGETGDEISFAINGTTFTFKNTDTLRTLINTVNSSAADVTLSYSELSDRLTLKSNVTGAASAINITNITGNAFGAGSAFAIEEGETANGQDALLSINGYAVSKSENNFTIDGLNYTLKAPTATPLNFIVERDIDTVVDRIKNFVTQYNDLVGILQAAVSEEHDSAFFPLTQAEKNEMSDLEIAAWEKKGKSGLLHNDRSITGLLNSMRRMLYTAVEGTGLSLSDIGLRTGNYRDGAKISLDETVLRTALARSPDKVKDLFTQPAGATAGAGFLAQLSASFTNYSSAFSETAARQEISKISVKIINLEVQLADRENFLYKKYAAMEQTLASLSSQSSWLASQFQA